MRYKLLCWETDVSWQYDAACLGVVARTGEDPFFHNDDAVQGKRKPSRVKQAKSFCNKCTVKQECLDFALDNDLCGVWGGTTEGERKKLRRGLGVGWLDDMEENDPYYHHCSNYMRCVTCGLCVKCCQGPHSFTVDELGFEG